MTSPFHPRYWPLTVRVPLLVASLVIVAAIVSSKMVLLRLAETQGEHFQQLTGAYLDGLSTALHPHVIRRDPWEAFDVLDRARSRYSGVDARVVLVVLPDGMVLSSSDPIRFPLQSLAPEEAHVRGASVGSPGDEDRVWVHRALVEGGVSIGRIAAEIDVTALKTVRATTLTTLVIFNLALTALFVGLGWLLVQRMLQPLTRLSDRLAEAHDGRLSPIPHKDLPPADTETGRAYRHYNAAAAAVAEREALLRRLTEEERRTMAGRLASAVAHEVNNPLGGLFNAVRMIQKHGDDPEQRNRAARLIERGLTGIQNIVRTQLALWRGDNDDRPLVTADVEDFRLLVLSEASRRDLMLDWSVDIPTSAPVSAQTVRQIALNLLLNAIAVSSPGGRIGFAIEASTGGLTIDVADDGPGLPDAARRTLVGESDGTLASAPGLGLWTVARLVAGAGGSVDVKGPPGTVITIRLPHAATAHELAAVA